MKLFQCQCCGQVLHFENTRCLRCGATVGFLPSEGEMAAVTPDGPIWHIATATDGHQAPSEAAQSVRWRFCANWERSACNWMLRVTDQPAEHGGYCRACRHNRTIPDLSDPENHARWQKIETAKRRLFYTLLALGLPLPEPGGAHPEPLVFDFLADPADQAQRVLTGHANGVVTIALSEADDAVREQMRTDMGEAYRTLLGHFRHEIGHYYWDLLVRDHAALEPFRALFGDESADYGAALQRHYEAGPPPGWQDTHVSSYATMHPWEDWAETWAHYLHMVDTLETAVAFGLKVEPELDEEGELSAELAFDPYKVRRFSRMVEGWMPLTVALNALNRSMGQIDLYPFVLPAAVQAKLDFVHQRIRGLDVQGGGQPGAAPVPADAVAQSGQASAQASGQPALATGG